MENLFLEILRMLDIRYNKTNTDYYFFSKDYYKKMLTCNNINNDMMMNILNDNSDNKKSLFMISKFENDKNFNKIDFNNPSFNFYKSRDILFFICIFIKYLTNSNIEEYEIEKNFINSDISEELIKKFVDIINEFKNKKISILYNNKSFFSKIKNNYNVNQQLNECLMNSIKLYFDYNLFTVGLKKCLDCKFEVCIFYIMLNIISNKIVYNKISKVYSIIEN